MSKTFWGVFLVHSVDSLRWFSQRRSPMPHFWGCAPRGYDPQIQTRWRFLYNAPSFIILSLLVRQLSCWQTHKQMPLKTSNALRYTTTLGDQPGYWVGCWCLWLDDPSAWLVHEEEHTEDLRTVQTPHCGPSGTLTRASELLHMRSPSLPCETQTTVLPPDNTQLRSQTSGHFCKLFWASAE